MYPYPVEIIPYTIQPADNFWQIASRYNTNADQIAAFMNSINPYWSKEAMREMMYQHLRLLKSSVVFRLTKDYASDIAIYDQIENQALEMADEFTKGIVKQFPAMFY